ncbi:MAG: hypothetical protein Q9172_004045 [Xanthocarpia lactea]
MTPNCGSSKIADASDEHVENVLPVSDHAVEGTAKPTQNRHRNSSAGSASSGSRTYPSRAVRDLKLGINGATQDRFNSDGWFPVTEEVSDPTKLDSAQHRRHALDVSSPAVMPRRYIDTQDVLTNFTPLAEQYGQKEKERKDRLNKHKPLDPRLKQQLERLKLEQTKPSAFASVLPRLFANRPKHDLADLKELATSYFPSRSEVKMFITDWKKHSGTSFECRLSEISNYICTKPSDIHVRWIHAPLGLGPLHSTIEDLFLHQGMEGRPFENLGRSGWPYTKIEVLNFIDRNRFQCMRDAFHLLHRDKIDLECWSGFEDTVLDDLKWRTTHLGLADDWETLPDYWTASISDIPWQISEGFLLTLSPMRGVNYLDRNFAKHLKEPGDAIFDNDVASSIALVRKQFLDSGTQLWHRPNVEWLLVHLMTEVGVTPHVDRQGCNAPTVEGAYQEVIQEFKRRRDQHFGRRDQNEPAELIKDMLVCREELKRMTMLSRSREQVFENLCVDVQKFEREDLEQPDIRPVHKGQRSAVEKAQIALGRSKGQTVAFKGLFEDISMSLESVSGYLQFYTLPSTTGRA